MMRSIFQKQRDFDAMLQMKRREATQFDSAPKKVLPNMGAVRIVRLPLRSQLHPSRLV